MDGRAVEANRCKADHGLGSHATLSDRASRSNLVQLGEDNLDNLRNLHENLVEVSNRFGYVSKPYPEVETTGNPLEDHHTHLHIGLIEANDRLSYVRNKLGV